jgi:DNA primase
VEVEFMTLLERDREKIEEGRTEGKEEDALNFLKLGVNDAIVAQGTGLSIEKVIELKNKLMAMTVNKTSK